MLVLRASCPVSSLPRSQTIPGPQDSEKEEEEEKAEAKELRNGLSKNGQGLHSESRFLWVQALSWQMWGPRPEWWQRTALLGRSFQGRPEGAESPWISQGPSCPRWEAASGPPQPPSAREPDLRPQEGASHTAPFSSLSIQAGWTPVNWQKESVEGQRASVVPTESLRVPSVDLSCLPHFLFRVRG